MDAGGQATPLGPSFDLDTQTYPDSLAGCRDNKFYSMLSGEANRLGWRPRE
jgi:hypothetical protein